MLVCQLVKCLSKVKHILNYIIQVVALFNDSLQCHFQFLVRYGCIKCGKSKD